MDKVVEEEENKNKEGEEEREGGGKGGGVEKTPLAKDLEKEGFCITHNEFFLIF